MIPAATAIPECRVFIINLDTDLANDTPGSIVGDDDDPSPWVSIILPIAKPCSIRAVNIYAKYSTDVVPDAMAGYLSFKARKNSTFKLNTLGRITQASMKPVPKNERYIHLPLVDPAGTNPKCSIKADIPLHEGFNEIKVCLTNNKMVPLQCDRMVIAFEVTYILKCLETKIA